GGLDERVVVLDELDLGALQDEVDLLDIALFELDFGKRRRHLSEGEDACFQPLLDEELYLVKFVKLSDSQVVVAPSGSAGFGVKPIQRVSVTHVLFPELRRAAEITTPGTAIP